MKNSLLLVWKILFRVLNPLTVCSALDFLRLTDRGFILYISMYILY